MKPLFSSLGSNYSLVDSVQAIHGLVGSFLFPQILAAQLQDLKQDFDKRFSGETFFFYKGRDAIEATLRAYGIGSGDVVLTQAFTCYALEEAILRTGAQPLYVDIGSDGVNLTAQTLQKSFQDHSNQNPKAVIVQYSLGTMAEIEKIRAFCDAHSLLLIEDLAQGFGGQTESGAPVGQYGDAVIFSFGRDKIIDAVSGGACCFRKLTKTQRSRLGAWMDSLSEAVPMKVQIRELVYPLYTLIMRKTWNCGVGPITVGKVLLFLGKKTHFLQSPLLVTTQKAVPLPLSYVPLLRTQYSSVESELQHRKAIVSVYQERFGTTAATFSSSTLDQGSGLRYPVLVKNPSQVAKRLQNDEVYLTDRWYREAVDCGTLGCKSLYRLTTAPQAEHVAEHVLTLPTHRTISQQDAYRIIELIETAQS